MLVLKRAWFTNNNIRNKDLNNNKLLFIIEIITGNLMKVDAGKRSNRMIE